MIPFPRVISDDALAALTIRGEADAEDMPTKVGVAEVIRNRMLHHYHSDGTVAGTVLSPDQFDCWWWKDPNLVRILTSCVDSHFDDAAAAWHTAMTASNTVNGALLYVNTDYQPQPAWATPDRLLATLGKLSFYKG